MKATHPSGVDIWINNAGIAYLNNKTVPFSEQSRETMEINFFGTVDMTKEALPIMAMNGRIVNVASMVAIAALKQCNDEIYKRVTDPNTTLDQVLAMGREFVAIKESEEAMNKGWFADGPLTSYGVSKMLLIKATQDLAKLDNPKKVIITSCCPGYVDTDMTNHQGPKTVQEGTVTPIYLAMLEDQSVNGQFFSEKENILFTRDTEFIVPLGK